VLRFHRGCPWRDENTGRTIYVPAIIAAFRSIDSDDITGVHRIRLDQPNQWPRTDRRMLGIVGRAAVKLSPISGGTLAVGEGVETCIAAQQLGLAPAWALGSVGAVAFLPLIEGVDQLTLLGEAGAASAQAIHTCGKRWLAAGRKVRVRMPATGDDLNTELMEAAR
jgi:hypothetical protein